MSPHDHSSDLSDRSDPQRPAAEAAASRGRRARGGWTWWAGGICLAIALALRTRWFASWDHAVVNVATLVFAGLGVIAVVGWLVFYSPFDRRVRIGAGLLVVLLAGAFNAVVRVQQVTGELVPTFVWRWRPRPDEVLGEVSVATTGEPVDLLSTTARDFPQFLGPHRDGAVSGVRLARDWSQRPPTLLWKRQIGAGWSSFAAVNGYAVTMEQRGAKELVVCYEVATGTPRWRHEVAARHESTLGGVGPRSTPTIDEGMVFALGATGVLRCLEGGSGKEIWMVDLLQRMGITALQDQAEVAWGRAASPLVVDGLVVVPYGGPPGGPYHSLAALRRDTGQLVWLGGERQIAYSSPRLTELAGASQILIVNQDFASGHDLATGAVLWEHPWPGKSNSTASCSQAAPLPGDLVLLSKGYGGGAALLQFHRAEDGSLQQSEVWRDAALLKTKFSNVVVRDGYAYALSDGVLECVEYQSGRRQWKRGRYGHGQILLVEDLLLVQAETGEVRLVEASPDELRELGEMPALEGKTWNTLCLYGSYLLVRNAQQAACFQLPLEEVELTHVGPPRGGVRATNGLAGPGT